MPNATITGTDWTLTSADAQAWASQYAGVLLMGITSTSATVLQGALNDFIAGRLTYTQMIAVLAPTFGSSRANLWATTEITRSYAQGTLIGLRASEGAVSQVQWNTVGDERVCESICDPMDGEVMPLEGGTYPPGHWRCRCYLSPFVGD